MLAQAKWGDLPWETAAVLTTLSALPAYGTMRLVEQPLAAGLAVGTGAANSLGDAPPFDVRALPTAAPAGPHLLANPAADRTGGTTLPSPAQARKNSPPDGACEEAPDVAVSTLCLFTNAPGSTAPAGLVRDPHPPAPDRLPAGRVVLIGDSHAGQWFSAVSRIASERGLAVEERSNRAARSPT